MGLFKIRDKQDSLSLSMQDEVIKIASERLGHPISKELIAKVRQKKWSYMGLEMIIDTVKSINASEIESYLAKLD
ncbi:hypothetical protein C3K47_19245 [Solitalea longa]|uniref:Uncharacterized protein n=1 Tax=Solitalea longa TaxID=2079460 RepID=A0A2S4ZX55_9SPHI|nr:hypothetical protein [Solitalea longa]POY34639.1 hypothetical protein C3K47_19245 [Solitalea longa]